MPKYPLTITKHARERFIVRIIDPKRYLHLTQCRQGCEECVRLDKELHHVINTFKGNIDRTIAGRVLAAIKMDYKITDEDFIQTMDAAYSFHKKAEYSNNMPCLPPEKLKNLTAKIVYEECQKVFDTKIEYWHDGVGIEGGYKINIYW